MSDNGDIVPFERDAELMDSSIAPPPRSGLDLAKEAVLVFPQMARLLYGLLRDPRIGRRRKMTAGLVGVYAVSPIDIIPDFIPVIGRLDDLLLMSLAIHHLLDGASEEVVAEHWAGSEDALDIVSGLVQWGAEMVPRPIRTLLTR